MILFFQSNLYSCQLPKIKRVKKTGTVKKVNETDGLKKIYLLQNFKLTSPHVNTDK